MVKNAVIIIGPCETFLRTICRQPTTGNCGFPRASHRNTKTYRPLPTILIEPLGRLFKISNNNCTECGRNPRYGYSGSPYEGDSHTILARDGEASHLCSTIHCMFRNLGSNIPIKALTKGMSWRESLLDAVQLEETLRTAGVWVTKHNKGVLIPMPIRINTSILSAIGVIKRILPTLSLVCYKWSPLMSMLY